MNARAGRAVTAGMTIAVALVMGSLTATTAMAAGTASISGTVTVPVGSDPTSVTVAVYPRGASDPVARHTVAADGTYMVGGFGTGSYNIHFETTGAVSRLGEEWWGGGAARATAKELDIGDGGTATIDMTLAEGAQISGTVGTTVPGVDLTQIQVYVEAADDPSDVIGYAELDSGGSYSVRGLAAGSYRVFFYTKLSSTGLASQFWNGAADFADASTMVLATGGSQIANATLTGGASIAGTISPADEWDGSAEMCALRVAPGTGVEQCSNPTANGGAYTISGLRAGTYKLFASFAEPAWSIPLPWDSTGQGSAGGRQLWWSDKLTENDAATVVVSADQHLTGYNEDIDTTGGQPTWPDITGTAKVGQRLSASPGAWPLSTPLRYAWYVAETGDYILGATASAFTPTPAQYGMHVGVEVYGNVADAFTGQGWQVQFAELRTAIAAGTLVAPTPKIAGHQAVGFILTAKPGVWTSGTSLSYQWYANGVAISGARYATYKLPLSMKGKRITVRVTGRHAGYTTASKLSAATARIALTAVPTITGTRHVGYWLTAHPGTWTTGTRFTYRWYANGVAITGAKYASFKLTSAQRGKTIKVVVTGSLYGYATIARSSAITARIG